MMIFLFYFLRISVARKLFCTFAVRNKFVAAGVARS
nr:MAG TPA: hypothetical protein [Caudoviricetes sp.]